MIETPKHYDSKITPEEYIMANKLDFNEGNIVKYISRHRQKNGAKDIKKLIHYACFVLKYDYEYSEEDVHEVFSKIKI